MSVTFNDTPLFGPAPCRLTEDPSGQQLLSLRDQDPTKAGVSPIGPLDPGVTVRGRLIGADESDLGAQVEAVRALLTDPPTTGVLADDLGRSWRDVAFVSFTPAGPVDRGRVKSLEFTARFIQFLPRA
jgi:hypothetical protein